jgi:phytoene dehydrogenase-like protein
MKRRRAVRAGMTRRTFMLAGGGWLAGVRPLFESLTRGVFSARPAVTGSIVGPAVALGHRVRDGSFPAVSEHRRTGVVIVGGGIAGLGTAWKLAKSGYDDYLLLELDEAPGGNARSGRNAVSAFPWGAHYVPIPGRNMHPVLELFEELGVIEGYDADGLPFYNELYLCADPTERLLIDGKWQDGIVPRYGLGADDRSQFERFFAEMKKWRGALGSDGRPAFAIPIDDSSRDPEVLALDRISMAEYLRRNAWDARALLWYVNYCCRDDYGCTSSDTSAWAGIHYFAARTGAGANAPAHSVLTWPAGNGWIVEALAARLAGRMASSCPVIDMGNDGTGVTVDYYDARRERTVRVSSDAAVCAAPRFVAARVVRELRDTAPAYVHDFTYAPWLVANVTLTEQPPGRGVPLAWDNVSFTSESLGYVVATHQEVRRYPQAATVLTYYTPLSGVDPRRARATALARPYEEWRNGILADLERMHPDISRSVTQLDVWLWGHGMIRPTPGFIWGASRQAALAPIGRIWFAHSDMSGISIFEEALYRGVAAAERAMTALGVGFHSSLGGAA